MDSQTLKNLVFNIRKKHGFSVEVIPEILGFHLDEKENFMTVVVADRPDKSAVFGPGGIISKTLAKQLKLKGVTVKAQTDVLVRRFRIKLAIKRLREIGSQTGSREVRFVVGRRLIPLLKNGLKNPLTINLFKAKPSKKNLAVVAFSGGVDSWVTVVVAREAGLNPIAVSVSPEKWILPVKTRKLIKSLASTYDVPLEFLKGETESFKQIFFDGLDGKIHPCGRCKRLIEKTVVDYAREKGIPLVLFGDLLPTGNYSAHLIGDVLRFNVLAALNLTKSETVAIAKMFNHPGTSFTYGCPMLREIHKKHPHLTYPSIQRVLRETRAGILEPSQALKYVKSILGWFKFLKEKG